MLAIVGDAAGSQAWVPSGFVDAAPGRRSRIEFRVEAVAVGVVTVRADGTWVDAAWQVTGAEETSWNAYVAPGTTRRLFAPGRYAVRVRRAALLDHASYVARITAGVDRGLRGDEHDLDVPAGEIVVPAGQARRKVEIVVPEAAGY